MTSGWYIISLLVLFAVAQDTQTPPQTELLSVAQRWGYGLATGLGLSLIGFVAAFVLVLIGTNIKSENFKSVVRVLFALACGTLLGDSMIHIMGEAYSSEGIDPLIVSGVFIAAILIFMWFEKVMEACGVTHSHWIEGEHDHGHDHAHEHKKDSCSVKNEQPSKEDIADAKNRSKVHDKCQVEAFDNDLNLNDSAAPQQTVADTPSPKKLEATADGSTEKGCLENWKGKGSAGYMNLVGSLIHNFMDGLTIGLGFATGDKYVYIPIVIAVFAHEIPRELGDVAILLESKFNNKQTIISNGVINLISIIGAIIGLAVVGTSEEVQTYIMVFVAGNFMYIAADIWRHLFKAKWLGNLMQQIFFAIGVGAMFGIKFLEDAPLVA